LTLLGEKTYGLLRNLTLPDKPATKNYDAIVKLLKDHLSPKPLIVAERFRFYKRYQLQGETVNKYVAELRRLAEYFEFGTVNESLRDQFVVEHTQKKLLAVADLTFVKAVETANKDAIELRRESNSVNMVRRHHRPTPSWKTGKQKSFVCYRCNGMNHRPDNCKFKDLICHNCNKRGHIRKACKSAQTHASSEGLPLIPTHFQWYHKSHKTLFSNGLLISSGSQHTFLHLANREQCMP